MTKDRAWELFKVKPIRIFGTNKTTPTDHTDRAYGRKMVKAGNCLDTVRGCPFGSSNGGRGCWWGCYSKEAMVRFHRLFDVPVSMVLREDLLKKDLRKLEADWVRIGVNGEPSCDWDLTLKVTRLCTEGGKRVVILTRLLRLPSDEALRELARLNVALNLTMCALDGDWDTRLKVARRYRELGGLAVIRLVSFAFAGTRHRAEQDLLAHLAFLYDVPVLEQPARLIKTNPVWGLVEGESYKPYRGYVSANSRWLCAGRQLNNGSMTCEGYCPTCPYKCGLEK